MLPIRDTRRGRITARLVPFACLSAVALLVGCSEKPVSGAKHADWKKLEFESFSVTLPGTIDTNSYSDKVGSHSFVSIASGTVVSLCLMPVTTVHLAEKDLASGGDKYLADSFATVIPALRGEQLQFERLQENPAVANLVRPKRIRGRAVAGSAWRIADSGWLAFLIVVTDDPAEAAATDERVRNEIRAKPAEKPAADPEATMLNVDVPNDWILSEDSKKRYWAKPSGTAFIFVSKPSPAPGSTLLPGLGMNESDAEQAVTVMESLSGRKSNIANSSFRFDKSLWMTISRATGTIEYKTGTFAVEMDRWINPHTGNWHRVYVGGLTAGDLAEAKAIRETRRFVRAAPGG